MNDRAKIVTFDSYYNPMMAQIVYTKLRANRVACFIADDNVLWAKPYFNQLLGGVKIKVFEKDLEKCWGILAENNELTDGTDSLATKGIQTNATCPYCSSINVRYGDPTHFKFHWPSLLVSLLVWVPVYFRTA
jgi:hypothetical protein